VCLNHCALIGAWSGELCASVSGCRKIRKSVKKEILGVTEIDRPLSLRAVAKLLVQHKLTEKSDKNGLDQLLGLLKTGEICAVATFPDILSEPLVISQNYWKKRGRDAMSSLLFKQDKGWHGTYTVKLADVAAEAYQKATRENQGTNPEQFAVPLIQQAGTKASVEVLHSEWRRYLKGVELSGSDDDETSGPGRRKKNWEAVYRELAAMLWFHIDRGNLQLPKQEAIADMIRENLRAQIEEGVPEASTIKDRIAQVRTRVEHLRAHFKEEPIK
jgi:hypothetical protein